MGDPNSPGAGADADMLALLATLDAATEIATKTRMNADYVPGAVTVLRGNELEELGVATVWDALGLVAGLQITRTNLGEPLVLVRGVGYSLLSGNLKILLNSVPMNNDIDGHAFPVLTLPIEQVERIEIYRGPGSALYGGYAYAGVVNVITRQDRKRVYLRAAGHETLGAGAMAHYEDRGSGLRLYGNLSGWHTDGAGTDSGPDSYFEQGLGYSPGPANDVEGNRLALLGWTMRDTTCCSSIPGARWATISASTRCHRRFGARPDTTTT
jgi:iron complex outermembrane receptor protein